MINFLEKYITIRRLVFLAMALVCLLLSLFTRDSDFKRRLYVPAFIFFVGIFLKEEQNFSEPKDSEKEDSDEDEPKIDTYA